MLPPIYKTNRYLLQPYRIHDEHLFIEMALDKEVVSYMGGANGIEQEERETFQRIFEVYNGEDKRWFWVWGVYEADRLCAHVELKQSQHTNDNELEIVYMVHPAERRKGLMTEILLYLKEQQQDWNKTIIATVYPDNLSSISLLNKWGIEKQEVLVDEDTGEEYFKFVLAGY